MMNSLKRQRGMTAVGWVLTLMALGSVVLVVLKVAPIYMENMTVKSVLNRMTEQPAGTFRNPAKMWDHLDRNLYMNEVRTIKQEYFSAKKESGKWKISLDYSVRENIAGNLDVIVTFSDSIVVE